ncbi:MAG: hypothetical protein COA57_09615 [Flavobacteriales bacterium]|nr:MAG: hypothetical protein COA57_09615 [Flavobacteriales bacterium]
MNNQIGCYNQNINVDGPPGNFPMPDSACPGDVIYLDAGFNTNDNSIEWDFGDGTTAGGYDVTHAYSTAGTYTITLIAQDQQCGIYDTIAQNIVITNNAPAYSFFSAWETPACPNDQITFDAQGVAGSIYWQFGDGNDTTVTQGRTYHSYSSIGTYTASLIVTNGCGNSDTSTQIINVYDTLSANVSNIDPQPDTACIGDALEFKYNGTLPSFFVWNYGDGNLDTNNTSPSHIYAANGTYTATVTVTNGCGNSASSSTTVLITTNVVPNPQDFDFGPIPQVACPGDSIIFYTNGGGVSYLWDFGDGNTGSPNTTFDNSPVVLYAYADTGTYNTTFTLTNGCGNSASVGVPVYIVDTASLIPPSWTGGQGFSFEGENGDGTQTVSVCQEIGFVSLVSGNYFIWNFGDGTVDTINGSLANTHVYTATGTYTISLFVQNSCGDTATFTTQITVSGTCLGPVASITSTNPSCNSNSDGIASASAVGGTSPYSYNWSTTATTANISGLAAGVYTVTVTDSLGLTGTASITLADPAVLSATTTTTNAACGSSDGTATATASGGTSPYSYAWSDGSTAATASNLAFGTYSVTATDVNGCTATATASVVNSSAPAVSISGTDESSCGTNDGFALVTVSGGASPYTYQWSNGATTKNITNVTAGNYSLTVTDANGCISTGSVTINAPTPPATSIATSDATACGTNDGVAALTITGGTTPYSYSWSNGSSNQNLTLVGGGTYVVIVTDANSCTAVDTAVIGAPGTATITITGTDISCYDANNGAADLTVTGGNLPYIYNWSNGETTEDLSGLGAGIYEVTVTDANGCIVNGDATINQPAAITISSTVTDVVTCGDTTGAIAIAVSGGSGTFSYSWSNGANSGSLQNLSAGTYSVTVTDASGCTQTENIVVSAPSTATLSFTSNDATCNESCDGNATVSASGGTSPFTYLWETSGSLVGQTDAMASGLCAGTYNVIVTEANGCVANDSVAISEPSALSLTISATDATCGITDGNATVSASGGTAPYDYQWTTGDSTTTADSIGSGIYIVTVTDANSCVEFALATINDVGGPSVTVNSTSDVTCNGNSTGAISLSVTAGTTPYTYSWSNGSTTEDIFNLIAGPYEVNVTDAGGCVAVQSISISEPDAISLSVSATDANCGSADGSATVSVTGGVSPYTYVWSSGATANSNSGLTSGTYIVTVTDANGCMAVTTAAISEVGGATIAIDSIVDAGCGGNGGSIYISTSGGVAPFSYTWSDGTGTEDLINAPAGIYDLTVIGANGCEATATAEISPAIPLTDPICLVSVDTATGGNLIAWQKDTTSGIAAYNVYKETSQSGVYFLAGTVPISSLSVFVDPNSNPLIQSYRYKLALVDSCGEESQLSTEHKTMHLTLSIGLIPGSINLIWDHYEGFSFNSYTIFRYTNVTGWDSIAALPSTNTSYTDFPPSGITSDLRYFVEAKHPNGCTATKASENYNSSRSNISQQLGSSPLLAAIISTDATFGNCDGTATVTPSGGEPPYTYQWDDANNQTDSTAVTLCPGIYNVTVTDFNGNTTTANVTVGEEVGVDEFTVHSSLFTVYPNPNEGVFTLKMENGKRKIENVELRVLNLLGEVVHQPSTQDISGQANHQSSIEIDLSGQPSGIYYLQIITNGGIAVKKVVIE